MPRQPRGFSVSPSFGRLPKGPAEDTLDHTTNGKILIDRQDLNDRIEQHKETLTRIIHQRRKKRLTEPGFTTKDAVTGCWEVCAAEIGRWEVENGVFGTQHSRRQLRNRVFGPSWAAKWGEVCPRRARRSLAQGMRS